MNGSLKLTFLIEQTCICAQHIFLCAFFFQGVLLNIYVLIEQSETDIVQEHNHNTLAILVLVCVCTSFHEGSSVVLTRGVTLPSILAATMTVCMSSLYTWDFHPSFSNSSCELLAPRRVCKDCTFSNDF